MELVPFIIVTLALAAGAIAKGATGMGLPLIAIPVIAGFLGLQQAVGVLVVPVLVTNAWQVWRFREHFSDRRLKFLAPFLVTAGLGVLAGTFLLAVAPERGLTLALGLLLLGYLALRLSRPELALTAGMAEKAALPVGLASGALHGSTGISAPIGVTFIHAMRLERGPLVLAVSSMFLVMVLVQLPALFLAGIMDPVWLLQGVYSLVPVAVFMPLGQWLAGRLSPKAFDRLILFFLGAMGLKMVLGI